MDIQKFQEGLFQNLISCWISQQKGKLQKDIQELHQKIVTKSNKDLQECFSKYLL